MTGDEVVRNIDERVVELRTALAKIDAEIAHSFADHREQAERLRRDMDAIQTECSPSGTVRQTGAIA